MLAALPFGWAQRFDTHFDVAHFERGRARTAGATQQPAARASSTDNIRKCKLRARAGGMWLSAAICHAL